MKTILGLICVGILLGCAPVHFESTYVGFSNQGKHSRGLSQTNNRIVAVSGLKGTYALFDLRKNDWYRRDSVSNMEDFRGVHLRTDGSLVLLNSGSQGKMWSVSHGGVQKLSYDSTGVFLDGLAFYPNNDFEGAAYGDPVDSTFMIFRTMNGGHTWYPISSNRLPIILSKEAGFAASGTGIQIPEKDVIYIGTGVAKTSRVLRSFDGGKSWDAVDTPMRSGDHYGIYSMHFSARDTGFVIGGSYKDSTYNEKICFFTENAGVDWINRSEGLPGYMSCINGNSDLSLVVTTGRMGTYYSLDKGVKWELLTEKAYYSCLVTTDSVILSGRDGVFEVIKYKLK